jgi:hypothetical protein
VGHPRTRRHGAAAPGVHVGPAAGAAAGPGASCQRPPPPIGGIFQHPPDHAPIPDGLAGAGHFARPRKPPTDLADGQAVAADPVKHLADHPDFVWYQLIARLPTPLILGNVTVPIGSPAEDVHDACPGRIELAAPMAFDNLRALILGHHALHLQQQVVFRAPAQLPVQEDHLHPGLLELIHQQPLVGVFARQPIGRVDIEPVRGPRGGQIALALQGGAHQGRPTITCIDELQGLGHRESIGGDPLAQRRHLTRHCMSLGLLGRRDSCIETSLNGGHEAVLLPPRCMVLSRPARSVWEACEAVRRVIGTTSSYAWATQAGLSRLGSNMTRTSSIVLDGGSRRATTASLLPDNRDTTGPPRLERCAQKSVTIPGAQMRPRDARRELYQHFCNFVGSVDRSTCGARAYARAHAASASMNRSRSSSNHR